MVNDFSLEIIFLIDQLISEVRKKRDRFFFKRDIFQETVRNNLNLLCRQILQISCSCV